jgi:hypothetical protein
MWSMPPSFIDATTASVHSSAPYSFQKLAVACIGVSTSLFMCSS